MRRWHAFFLLSICCYAPFLSADKNEEGAAIECADKDKEVLVKELKGMLLMSSTTNPSSTRFFGGNDNPSGINLFEGMKVPGRKTDFGKVLQPYLGKPLTFAGIEDIRRTISTYYAEHHHPIVSVIIPPQDITGGTLKISILEGTVGNVNLIGNRWTSDKFLRRSVGVSKGSKINSADLKRNLAWVNRNPFRQTDAVFHPGATQGTTDIDLVTADRFPFQPYIGADNTGTPYTQRTRLYTGFNAGNIWGIDHRASYQYTTSPDSTSFSAQSGSYTMPFSWQHQAHFYGGWSRGRAHLHNHMKNHAESWQVSGRYQIPLNPIYGKLLQEISFGYDFKRTNNSLLFGGLRVSNKFADTNQFMFGYSVDYHTCKSKTSFILELYGSPFEITDHQNKQDYESIRPYANPRYAYGKVRLSETIELPHEFVVKGLFAAQGTGWNLLPNEMFGLGGYNTVRGYDERAVNVDDAILASIEFDSPGISFFKSTKLKTKDKLDFLAFFDYGFGAVHKATFADLKTYWLAGTGVGVRYSIGTYLFLRMDLGFPLHKTGVGLYDPHLHVGATVSY